jgi:hypothetical protein
MKLYKLITGLGTYWVIAKDPTEAETKLNTVLNAGSGYGFSEVKEIHLVAQEIPKNGLTQDHPYRLTGPYFLN